MHFIQWYLNSISSIFSTSSYRVIFNIIKINSNKLYITCINIISINITSYKWYLNINDQKTEDISVTKYIFIFGTTFYWQKTPPTQKVGEVYLLIKKVLYFISNCWNYFILFIKILYLNISCNRNVSIILCT